jgi:hypothetical protein
MTCSEMDSGLHQSVAGWFFNVIDDDNFDGVFGSDKFETKLLVNESEE